MKVKGGALADDDENAHIALASVRQKLAFALEYIFKRCRTSLDLLSHVLLRSTDLTRRPGPPISRRSIVHRTADTLATEHLTT